MDSTESHLSDLAHRSLLEMQEEEEPKFRMFKSCRLHDLIRELCTHKGKEEEFFEIADPGNGNKPSPSRTPRLAIHLNKYDEGGSNHVDKANVRSLLVFDTRDSQPKSSWPQELSDLKDFALEKGMEKLACLRYLSFLGCYLNKLPKVISSFWYLVILDLRVTRRTIVPISLKRTQCRYLERLPNLRSLVLNNDAYEGKEMKCSASDFPELRSLKLLNLHYLETWKIDEGSMQNLSTLVIEKCSKLKMLPPGLKFAKNLKEVKVVSMNKEFVSSINEQLYGEEKDSACGSRRMHIIVLEGVNSCRRYTNHPTSVRNT
ncbi:Disease resistance protein RPP8 [Sesamum alatum]|uniref:Disease resistance protein RPP8 n=1 Tax=Sesamum alatum TaxID=300844 RepID=A0AAE1Y8D1_9LAMI|nr:Disease resistance protein RPP8 [Sesamum alatum]